MGEYIDFNENDEAEIFDYSAMPDPVSYLNDLEEEVTLKREELNSLENSENQDINDLRRIRELKSEIKQMNKTINGISIYLSQNGIPYTKQIKL